MTPFKTTIGTLLDWAPTVKFVIFVLFANIGKMLIKRL